MESNRFKFEHLQINGSYRIVSKTADLNLTGAFPLLLFSICDSEMMTQINCEKNKMQINLNDEREYKSK